MVELTVDWDKEHTIPTPGLDLNSGWMNFIRRGDDRFIVGRTPPPVDSMGFRGSAFSYLTSLLNTVSANFRGGYTETIIPSALPERPYGPVRDILSKRFLWEMDSQLEYIEFSLPLDIPNKPLPQLQYEIYSFESAREATWNLLLFCNKLGTITAIVDRVRQNILLTSPHPITDLPDELRTQYSQSLQGDIDMLIGILPPKPREKPKPKKTPSIWLGSDIEFSFLDSDKDFHAAYEFVADNLQGEIGTDGNAETLEIRPEKARTPDELTEHTKEILQALDSTLPDGIDLWCGGGGDIRRSTGLHIHFSGMSTDINSHGEQEVDPRTFAVWLDQLLAKPILKAAGIQRGDRHYGQLTDVRHQANHHGFPHRGFEYRTLPTVCINERITRAIFAIAWMAAIQFETIGGYKFDEKKPLIEWYRNLPKFADYEKDIEVFCDYVEGKGTFAVPCLASWFNKTFHKAEEGDVVVQLSDDLAALFGEVIKMYNPQRFAHYFYITTRRDEGNSLLITKKVKASVVSWLIQAYGVRAVYKPDFREDALQAFFKKDVEDAVAIGLPKTLVKALSARSNGSRQYIKIFIHQLIHQL